MPEGSSSEAPVIRPGPRTRESLRSGLEAHWPPPAAATVPTSFVFVCTAANKRGIPRKVAAAASGRGDPLRGDEDQEPDQAAHQRAVDADILQVLAELQLEP